jgi:ribosomal protein L37AE/L43A
MKRQVEMCNVCGLHRVVIITGNRRECSCCGALLADAPGQPVREVTRASEGAVSDWAGKLLRKIDQIKI